MSLTTICGHCGDEYDHTDGHDCTPECRHCGATFEDLDDPEYDNPKIDISRHQRECDERDTPDEPFYDPEGHFRRVRRERKRRRENNRRIEELRRKGQL